MIEKTFNITFRHEGITLETELSYEAVGLLLVRHGIDLDDAMELLSFMQIATAGRYEGEDWSLVFVAKAPQYH